MSVILALKRLRQEDQEFDASLGYTARLRQKKKRWNCFSVLGQKSEASVPSGEDGSAYQSPLAEKIKPNPVLDLPTDLRKLREQSCYTLCGSTSSGAQPLPQVSHKGRRARGGRKMPCPDWAGLLCSYVPCTCMLKHADPHQGTVRMPFCLHLTL
jgi:hypothetical protein